MAQTDGDPTVDGLDVLVGQWSMELRPPAGSPWAGGRGRTSFEWLDGDKFLIQRWAIEAPEAPDGIAIVGAGDAPGSLRQHYFDSRGVHRVYEMSLAGGIWKLWREAPDPFPQRYTGAFSDDGDTITGRWEKADSGSRWETDFDLTYRRLE